MVKLNFSSALFVLGEKQSYASCQLEFFSTYNLKKESTNPEVLLRGSHLLLKSLSPSLKRSFRDNA
jgi:hypothetical protein